MILKDQHFVHVVVEESLYYFLQQEIWFGHAQYLSMRCLMMKGHGGFPGSWSQKDGILGVDLFRAVSDRSVQVEASWEVVWIFWMAWWSIDGLSLVGELRACALLRLASR